jgi:hypothetical protein
MKLAKRFSITCELFTDDLELFRQPPPDSMTIINSPDRYSSRDRMKEGVLAELYASIPERLHDMMRNDSAFGRTVTICILSAQLELPVN